MTLGFILRFRKIILCSHHLYFQDHHYRFLGCIPQPITESEEITTDCRESDILPSQSCNLPDFLARSIMPPGSPGIHRGKFAQVSHVSHAFRQDMNSKRLGINYHWLLSSAGAHSSIIYWFTTCSLQIKGQKLKVVQFWIPGYREWSHIPLKNG